MGVKIISSGKILFIANSLAMGGKERQIVGLVSELKKKGYFIKVVVFDNAAETYDIKNILNNVIYLSGNYFTKYFGVIKVIKKYKPDFVQFWDFKLSLYVLPYLFFNKKKIINSSIRSAPPEKYWYKKKILVKFSFLISDIIVSNSKAGIKAYFASIEKSRVIYNGIDFNRKYYIESRETIKRKYRINSKYVIGMVANCTPNKDYRTFLQLAFDILKDRSDLTFLLVGDGPLCSKYKLMIPKEYDNKIIFTGSIQKVEEIIDIFDIAVLLSDLSIGEGLSNAIMEYMLFGKVVIATDLGGNNELIEENYSGFLVKENDILALKNNVLYLLENPSIRKKMGENGYRFLRENFSMEKMANEYSKLYSLEEN